MLGGEPQTRGRTGGDNMSGKKKKGVVRRGPSPLDRGTEVEAGAASPRTRALRGGEEKAGSGRRKPEDRGCRVTEAPGARLVSSGPDPRPHLKALPAAGLRPGPDGPQGVPAPGAA